jgi:hypothetical protein
MYHVYDVDTLRACKFNTMGHSPILRPPQGYETGENIGQSYGNHNEYRTPEETRCNVIEHCVWVMFFFPFFFLLSVDLVRKLRR